MSKQIKLTEGNVRKSINDRPKTPRPKRPDVKIYPRIWLGVKTENGVTRSYLDNSILDYENEDDLDLDDIHSMHEQPTLPLALQALTDEYIENDNYCTQTIMDMRDALKWFMEREK